MSFSLQSLLSFSGIFKQMKSKIRRGKTNFLQRRCLALPEELCCRFSLAEIKAATNNFHKDMVIAKGDSGFIYGGMINDGFFAIKRLRPSTNSLLPLQELKCGARMLCQLHHSNIVSLVGWCEEKGEMIHVYEYVSSGTLYDHLHGKDSDPLPWKRMLEICIGVARALHYLHTGARFVVIHRDVTSSSRNILLDGQWTAKLYNFGFSKRGPHSMMTNRPSHKADVYSFGVVLFEVLCCRRVFDATLNGDQRHLNRWACKCIENGTIYDIIDPYLKGRIASEYFKKFVEIAYSCVSFDVNKRPAMGEVEVTLELALERQNKADSKMECSSSR
ncbi:Malectin/receptor-like protein kinase family protein, putative [Theobroma cacao]|uniref:Malectin/receptor-like protein kinase family protein, putative n=1 Tax=Theobroma cacao TaxID=3641 RepID=A0A061EFI5_THECC|nr:Malectin/receptor-like protein kinase family protein, putative [Theobroma cacao]